MALSYSARDNKGVPNYGYDEFNNRSYKEEVGDSYNYESYLYDDRNQLIATLSNQDTKFYDYDIRGNDIVNLTYRNHLHK